MTRSIRLALLLLVAAATAAAGQSLVWPEPPAEPVIRFESVVRKLADFELAIQGPTGISKRIQKLKRPSGVAFDARGRLLVSDARQSALMMIDADLGVVLVYGTGTTPSLREPMGVAVADDGTIFVADAGLRGAVSFDPSGEIAAVYGDSQMEEPTDVALSPDGSRLYVTDARANSIAIFDVASRQRVETFGARGNGVAEFQAPSAVEFDSQERLLIVDQLNSRVQIFDAQGGFTRALQSGGTSGLDRPADVAVDAAGRIYVTDVVRSEVAVYDQEMDSLLAFGRNGLRDGEFLGVGSIAAAGDRLAVLDRAGGRILLFKLYGIEAAPTATIAAAEAPAAEPGSPEPTEPPMEATRLTEEAPTAPAEPEMPASAPKPAIPAPPIPAHPIEAPAAPATPEPTAEVAEELIEETMTAEDTTPEASTSESELIDRVEAWADAWSAQDADSYLDFYAGTFEPPDGGSLDDWAALRHQRISSPASMEVTLDGTEIESLGTERADVTFVQSYSSDRFSDRVLKRLELIRHGGEWKIERETVLEVLSAP